MMPLFAAVTFTQIVTGVLFAIGVVGLFHIFSKSKEDNESSEGNVSLIGWGVLQAVTVTVAIYVFSQIVGSITVGLYVATLHGSSALANVSLQNSDTQFVYMLVTDLVGFYMVYLFLKHRHTAAKAIGLVRPRFKDILYAVAGFLVYIVAYIALLVVVRALLPNLNLNATQDVGFNTQTSGTSLLFVFLGLVVLPPLFEEVLMRGVLYTGLRTRLPILAAALITSGLFAAAHLPEGKGGLLWVGAIDTFALSLVLVYLREKTKSLWPSIGLHAIKNCIAFLALFVFHAA